MLLSTRSIVWVRPQLLDHHIREQYLPALSPDTRDDYSREERMEALAHVVRLASLRHESAADTLRDLLDA